MSATARWKRSAVLAIVFASTSLCPFSMSLAKSKPSDGEVTLEDRFRDPPNSARPRVWWHWMNGNVTEEGIAQDLDWMKRIGIGGLTNFDAALTTPQIVDKRLAFMTPEWKRAFRFAAERADRLGLEFGIAASPGWSETGGPWVAPENGMKKLVWTETVLKGGKRLSERLPQPPFASGPYQQLVKAKEDADAPTAPTYYQDTLVLAYPVRATSPLPRPAGATVNGQAIDTATLIDGDLATGVALPPKTAEGPGVLALDYGRAQTVQSAFVFITNQSALTPFGRIVPRLEASDDGKTWRTVADLHIEAVPTTVSFAPVTARYFQLSFLSAKGMDTSVFAPAPGADLSSAATGKTEAKAPTQVAEFRLSPIPRVNAAEAKAGFSIADDYYALDATTGPDVKGVDPKTVVDLTARMARDGTLDWTPPAGTWKILRLGYSLTGTMNHPATAEGTGLEVDKYDAAAVRNYLGTYLRMYRSATGDALIGRRGLHSLLTDSTEVGASNWTPRILAQFQRLRGYDPLPWLPALTGEVVGSRRESDAFLYDFRRTLGELAATEHYGTVAKVAHDNGLVVYGESLEGQRGLASLGDDIEMRRYSDAPMGALWTFGKKSGPGARFVADLRGAASAAHFYGRTLVSSETLTSIFTPWGHSPGDLQPMIDVAFVNGVNQPMIHTSVHQPVDDKVPGLSLNVFGQYFTRHDTWAEMAKPWMDYIARTSFLLQQGRNIADVAYFYGEEAPVGLMVADGRIQGRPMHYAYDFVSAQGVLDGMSADKGDLLSAGGARYKLLYLGGSSSRMTLPVLERLAALAAAGATIVGERPNSSPSLNDDPAAFARLAGKLWAGGAVTSVGKGRVIAGTDVEAALAQIGVVPDFVHQLAKPEDVQFVHRGLDDGELYYVVNRTSDPQKLEARFRGTGRAPEIWRADTGETRAVSYRMEGGQTVVPLDMLGGESFFVVFRKPATTSALTVNVPVYTPAAKLDGPWAVTFQPGRGAPAKTELAELGSLADEKEPGIRYFSGVASYSRSFQLPKGIKTGAPLMLDLGRIGDVAAVRVNGKLAGTVWKAPYQLDIGSLVRSGKNALEVRVANLWVNRLIGDVQPGAQKVTFTALKTYMPKAPLRPSGLIGPVTLLTRAAR